jgi:hypothetical protein
MTGARGAHTVAAMTTTINRIQDERLAAVLSLFIAAIALAFANFAGNGSNGVAGPYAAMLAVSAILAAVLFARVLPNAENPARTGWILAALAIVTCAVFWTGAPFVLGMGAAYSGARAGKSGPVLVGALAIAAAAVACVIG